MRSNIYGTWTVQTVSVEGVATSPMNALVFNEANLKCFIGSMWTLRSRTNIGQYDIPNYGKDCSAVKRSIQWSIKLEKDGVKEIRFTRLDENKKALDNAEYRMTISLLNENSMQLRYATSIDDKPGILLYNFTRN